jgi:VanZ family protein
MALLFVGSSFADPSNVTGGISDKILHVGAYAALGLLILRALGNGRLDRLTTQRAILAVVLTVLYGLSDEFHQSFVPGRTPELMDVAADAVGATIGVSALLLFRGLVHRFNPRRERG